MVAVCCMCWVFRGDALPSPAETEFSFYTSTDNDMFNPAASAALAFSDVCFIASGHPSTNPANFSDDVNAIALDYAAYYGNVLSVSSLTYRSRIDEKQHVSMSANYLLVPDIMVTSGLDTLEDGTLQIDEDNIRYGNASTMLASFSYARRWLLARRWALSAGIQVRAKRKNLLYYTDDGALGYAIGALSALTVRDMVSGAVVSVLCDNVPGQYMYYNSDFARLGRPSLQLGAGWAHEIDYLYGALQIGIASKKFVYGNMLEGTTISGGDAVSHVFETAHYGLAYTIHELVTLRVGSLPRIHPVTFGGGVSVMDRRLRIDFAYRHHTKLAGSYQMGMGYAW